MAGEVRVRFRALPKDTFTEVLLPAVPRVGEYVSFAEDDTNWRVDAVSWHPGNPRLDVFIILRDDESPPTSPSKETADG